jgi:site-specific DNA recombinase
MLKALYEAEGDGARVSELEAKIAELLREERVFFQLQSKGIVDKSLLKQEHEALVGKINMLRGEKSTLQGKVENEDDRYKKTLELSSLLQETKKPITEFSDRLFDALVERIIVKERECLMFQFFGGLRLEERYTFKYGSDIV